MTTKSRDKPFFFCIPLMPKANASDWKQVCEMFRQTLKSLENQTDKYFRVFLAAHDVPSFLPGLDLDIIHLPTRWTAEGDISGKLRDKRWKRKLLLRAVAQASGGYTMLLDADDLVSRFVVEYVRDDADPNGYIFEKGYAFDWKARLLAPIPGVWRNGFDSACGSCSIINFLPNDLPPARAIRAGEEGEYLSAKLKQHAQWKHVMAEAGRPLKPLPFPGAVYVLNHDNSLHDSIVTDRRERISRNIKSKQVQITTGICDEFSLPTGDDESDTR